ncbi:MAG: hypothetical protein E6212_03415 [Actinomyces sp.]|nr:hypothetical protein [Actinomyces sp.]
MTTHTDDWMAPGDDELGFGGLAKLKPVWKWALVIAALSVAALAVSTSLHQDVVRRPVSSLRSNDAVIALRLGPQYRPSLQEATNTDSWIVLLDAQGRGTVASVDSVVGGDVLWSDRGIFYGSRSRNYVTTDSGTQVSKSDNGTRREIQRYELSDGQLVTLVPKHWDYNDGDVESDDSITTVETAGITGAFEQCGTRILAITDTKESPSIADAAFEAYAAQASDEDVVPEVLTAVVQLNVPDGDAPRILAVAPAIDNLLTVHRMLACEGDVITLQSLEEVKSGTPDNMTVHELYRWVPLRWDLSTGERTYIPLTGDDGEPFEFGSKEAFYGLTSIQVGSEYRMVTWDGDALGVELMSGKARRLFYTNPRMPVSELYWLTYQVDKDGVYALGESYKGHIVSLFFRPWDGKEWREIFTTDKLAGYLKEGWFSGELKVQSFAVRPGWNGGAQ